MLKNLRTRFDHVGRAHPYLHGLILVLLQLAAGLDILAALVCRLGRVWSDWRRRSGVDAAVCLRRTGIRLMLGVRARWHGAQRKVLPLMRKSRAAWSTVLQWRRT